MDQDQAINLLDNLVSQQTLTRQQHAEVALAVQILRELNKRFKAMVIEKNAKDTEAAKAAIKKRVNPEVKPPDAKEPLDNIDRSEA